MSGGIGGGFSGGSGSYGDSTGPATSGAIGNTFGNIVSGGSGSFNPFANSTAANIFQPQTVAIIAVSIVALVYFLKKK